MDEDITLLDIYCNSELIYYVQNYSADK